MSLYPLRCSRATCWLAALPLAAVASAAQAQPAEWCTATLAYVPAPVPTSVPTLTTWAVLLLASVLGLVAMRRIRMGMGTSGQHWAVMLGLALVLATGSGGMLVNHAIAAAANLSNPAGGSVVLDMSGTGAGGTTATLTNTTRVPLTITSVTANSAPVMQEFSSCKVGLQLRPGASCTVSNGNCVEP